MSKKKWVVELSKEEGDALSAMVRSNRARVKQGKAAVKKLQKRAYFSIPIRGRMAPV